MPGDWLEVPHHRQEADWTCVPACVRMVFSYYGLEKDEEEIARLLEADATGTAFGMIRNVAQLGFDVRIGPGQNEDLRQARPRGMPLIVAVRTLLLPKYVPPDSPHAVVVAGATAEVVAFADPWWATDLDLAPATTFDAAWKQAHYKMAVITPR